jgi:metal-responsive CopG/Arc/MetJ family transcriptional regulator
MHTLRCMIRTQIYLTEEEHNGISELARVTRRRQSELIRQAIDEYLTRKKPEDKLSRIRRAKGIWKNRTDLDLSEIRANFDRF